MQALTGALTVWLRRLQDLGAQVALHRLDLPLH